VFGRPDSRARLLKGMFLREIQMQFSKGMEVTVRNFGLRTLDDTVVVRDIHIRFQPRKGTKMLVRIHTEGCSWKQ
jgi:hypothetical protein